jgi:hypothetical protein
MELELFLSHNVVDKDLGNTSKYEDIPGTDNFSAIACFHTMI